MTTQSAYKGVGDVRRVVATAANNGAFTLTLECGHEITRKVTGITGAICYRCRNERLSVPRVRVQGWGMVEAIPENIALAKWAYEHPSDWNLNYIDHIPNGWRPEFPDHPTFDGVSFQDLAASYYEDQWHQWKDEEVA